MRTFLKALLVPSILILTSSATAASKKTHAHECATYRNHAIKAGQLYSYNKKQARNLHLKIKALKKDKKRIPQSVKLTKKVLNHKIIQLNQGKKQRLATSLKYLEKHILYRKAALQSCSRLKQKKRRARTPRFSPKSIMTIAGN